jgi:hypothetical protein
MNGPATELTEILSANRGRILEKWLQAVIATYPADTARFLFKEKDRFANPVGRALMDGVGGIFDCLLQNRLHEATEFLDKIIRIRAIQDFSPSQAVVFVFFLKKVVRQELESESFDHELADALSIWEERLDQMALQAFDVYMSCREKLYELRFNEMRRQTSRLVDRINRIYEGPNEPPENKGGDLEELV